MFSWLFSWLLRRRIAGFERAYGYDMSYAYEILEHDPKALLLLGRAQPLASYGPGVPRDVFYAAKLVSALHEDCGPCVQLVITMAERANVPSNIVREVVRGAYRSGAAVTREGALPEPVLLAARYAEAVANRDAEAEPLRQEVLQRFGHRGLVSLAFAITGARIFPTLKYALGHGQSCQRLHVAGKTVEPLLFASEAQPQS